MHDAAPPPLSALQVPHDVFIVFDAPPTPDDPSLAGVGPSVAPSLLDSALRATNAFKRMRPLAARPHGLQTSAQVTRRDVARCL